MWCVVHVRDGGEVRTEDFVAGLLPENLNARCFHLIRNRRMKYQGQWHTVQEDLFPGYVFIDTDEPDKVYRELKKTPRPKLLFSDDDYVSTLERRESDLMERLTDRTGVIGISKVHIRSDGTIRYLTGPLARMGYLVKKKPDRRVWCIDGDGAALMHMGAMAVIGSIRPKNLIHVVINNGAHETVGGQPTAAGDIDLALIVKGCGYPCLMSVDTFGDLDEALKKAKNLRELCFIEVKCGIGARADLGRPTIRAAGNKELFINYLKEYKI